MASPPGNSSAPVLIPGFEVLEPIGHGGFSVVYRARQVSMQREVAVKVLNTGFASEVERRRFERECHALGRLSRHPNIVTVFSDAMTSDGRPAIVMELYESTLRDRLGESGPFGVAEVLSIGVRVCGALAEAHAAGVLHRDLKPHNIFWSVYGEPALGDFGISTIDAEKSQSGFGALSIAYAAPEMIDDGTVDARSDVYSLGASLYQLVAGVAPFASSEVGHAIRRILTELPAPISRPGVPGELNELLLRVLAKDPGDRPSSAMAFADELRRLQQRLGHPPTPIPRTTASGAPTTSTTSGVAGGTTAVALDDTTADPPTGGIAAATAGRGLAHVPLAGDPPQGAVGQAPSSGTPSQGAGSPPPPPPPFPAPAPPDATIAREGVRASRQGGGPPSDDPPPESRSGSGGNRRWLVIGVVALIVVVGGAILALAMGGDDDGGAASDSTTPRATTAASSSTSAEPEPTRTSATTSTTTTTTTRPPRKTTTTSTTSTSTTTTTLPPTPDFAIGECVTVDDPRSDYFIGRGNCDDASGPWTVTNIMRGDQTDKCPAEWATFRGFTYCLAANILIGQCYNFRDTGNGVPEENAFTYGEECGPGKRQVYDILPGTTDHSRCAASYDGYYIWWKFTAPAQIVCAKEL